MDWKLIVAVIGAGLISSFTDWFFMGVLFRDRYTKYPETWWVKTKTDEMKPILYSTAMGFITAAAIIGLCELANASSLFATLTLAVVAWLAGPLVVCITNGFWIRIDPAVTFAHSIGYLARFLIAAVAASWALGGL
ncbi:MAG TPA: hypothetical protein VGG48_07760 [Rhizomicrobium sp.]|jgi:hypothetical protein